MNKNQAEAVTLNDGGVMNWVKREGNRAGLVWIESAGRLREQHLIAIPYGTGAAQYNRSARSKGEG